MVQLGRDLEKPLWGLGVEVGALREVLAEEWTGPRKLDLVMEP